MARSSSLEHSRWFKQQSLIRMCVSVSQNSAASGLEVCVYSPGHSRKKNPNINILAMQWLLLVCDM
jgi:hypothetical protein